MAIPFKYNRRSLLIRRVSNSMTVGAIAIVVGVFVAAMAIVGGLDSAIKDSSSPDNMILIGRGADSEANSSITLDQLDALRFLPRSEEHTSELQSHVNLVCRLLLEKKKKKKHNF